MKVNVISSAFLALVILAGAFSFAQILISIICAKGENRKLLKNGGKKVSPVGYQVGDVF